MGPVGVSCRDVQHNDLLTAESLKFYIFIQQDEDIAEQF